MISEENKKTFNERVMVEALARFTGNSRGTPIARNSFIDGAIYERELADTELAAKDKEIADLKLQREARNEGLAKAWKEIEELKAWKQDALTVLRTWNEVDEYVRKHGGLAVGESVQLRTIEMLDEKVYEQLKNKKV